MDEVLEECLYMGNLYPLRDWGHARDYVVQWLMLQKQPEDFVIATGRRERAPLSSYRRSSWAGAL